ncbi:MAG: hypothetical protein NTW38_09350 [Candidatus Aminicenantes bacterium]|nr:hypothetical protein [Candidatus Aminicenantes bacterium]
MNAPYWLIPIGLFLALFYGISLLFSRLDILSKAAHRRIWNYGLLATFLITAALGVLMAVQVDYKLDIPWTEKILKVHVNFGLGMSLVGLFHLFWHGSYFFRRRTRGAASKAAPATTALSSAMEPSSADFALPFGIGFSGVLVQALLIRDFLTLFEGNELTISLIVFLWLLLTGAGSLCGASARLADRVSSGDPIGRASTLVKALLVVPLIIFPLMFYVKSLLFAPGIEAGPLAMAGFLAFILLPFCFLNGFSFTWAARALRTGGRTLRTVYGWESIGGAAGGLLCTAAVLLGLPSLSIVFSASAGLLFLIAAIGKTKVRTRWILPAVPLVLAVFVQIVHVDRLLLKRFYPNERLVGTVSGSSGRLTVTRAGDQVNVYENGILVHASGNTILNEELAAFSLVQSEHPDRVLLIGGLLTGLPDELAKYGVKRIDIVEPDPHLIGLAGKLGLISESPGTRLIRGTPIRWIDSADLRYEAVLINLPGPGNLQLNRFYTVDFFRRVKRILTPDGGIAAVLPGTANYVSEGAASSLGSVVSAARMCFREASIFPGENSYLVMADRPLRTDILSELRRRGIANLYVNPGYFDEKLFCDRIEQVNGAVGNAPAANSDLKPAAYLSQIRWWLGRFPENVFLPGSVILAALILFGIFSGKPLLAGMFLLGAASSGWSILLLLLVQIIAGALYQWTGLFLGMFMIGLAAGSLSGPQVLKKARIPGIGGPLAVFVVFSAVVGFLAPWLAHGRGPGFPKMMILLLAGFIVAAAVGAVFAGLSVKLENDAGRHDRLYGYDLLGSAIGAVGFPMVVIPLAGLQTALFALSLAGVLAFGVIALGGARRITPK